MKNRILFLLLMSCCISACAPGSGDGLDANGRPANASSTDLSVLKPELNSIQYNIFTPYCSGCHSGAGAAQGLKLDNVDNSYSLLVNQLSSLDGSLQRVMPNNPDNSFLVHKIEGIAGIGDRMPLGQGPLAADMIAAIRQWIVDGAEEAQTITSPQVFFDPTLESIQLNLFNTSCIACHSGVDAARGLRLDSVENSYNHCVDQDSDEVPSIKLVAPFDPDNSYLIQKLEGTAYLGSSMPIGLARITQDRIDIVRQWIADGANRTLPTLSSIQSNVFDQYCISCHAGATPSAGLSLETGNSYNQLIAQTSIGDSNIMLVAVADANNSYLIQKLEGSAGGLTMPLGGSPLPQEMIDVIRLWIDSGAANN